MLVIERVDLGLQDPQALAVAAHILIGCDHPEQQLRLGLAQALAAGGDVGRSGLDLGADSPEGVERLSGSREPRNAATPAPSSRSASCIPGARGLTKTTGGPPN
jgi:hypothetical protein